MNEETLHDKPEEQAENSALTPATGSAEESASDVPSEATDATQPLTGAADTADITAVEASAPLAGGEVAPEVAAASEAEPAPAAAPTLAEELGVAEEDEEPTMAFVEEGADIHDFSKKDLVDLAEKLADAVGKSNVSAADMKNIDAVVKQIQPIFEEISVKEKGEALKSFIATNGTEEGFEFKNDNYTIRFEALMVKIRDARNKYYRNQKQLKEDYFETKTALLDRLRVVVEEEDKGGSKENWQQFKKIQDEWKEAGNVNSPHNGSLWSAYNALVDRYFDIRSIQNELKDLDRKKNLEAKTEVVVKIEDLAKQLQEGGFSRVLFKQANDLLEEYKQIGPAAREEQEALWARLKLAFDGIYSLRREQQESSKKLQDEVLDAKLRIIENLKPYTEFTSTSINEWNAKSKEILALQDQWTAIKGGMPREKGREVSKDFWNHLKTFFRNKSQFFAKLEAERDQNLKAKNALIEKVEALLAAGDTSADATNAVVELQKTWRTIGHVPEKQKESIYERFKKAADEFFELKRAGNKAVESEFQENLKTKEALIEKIEKLAADKEVDLKLLPDFKKEFAAIGFVPRKDMKSVQSRFVDAINKYVKASGNISKAEEEKLLLKNEVDVILKTGGDNRSLSKQENDLRRRIKQLEDDINLWQNNILFFGHSKGAEKLRADYDKKISKAEEELKEMQSKLKLFTSASN